MSIFSIGRPNPAAPATNRVWSWPLSRNTAAAPLVNEGAPARWWRRNPYLASSPTAAPSAFEAGQIEKEGRREGYLEGKRDQQRLDAARARRSRHPILTLVVFAAALSGVAFTGLAFEMGSFSAAGAVVDQTTAAWRADVFGAAGQAVDKSGRAVQSAGQTISEKSQSITRQGR